ncbi:MAG: 4-hydroxy-tetrahydrodipicolinate synthase [Clostridia bacterium]|nr:4-hydroxy-tetrahydrodipicolinate synthase [Clostridia bacterium]
MSIFTGSATAMITPFRDGNVDFEAFGKLLDFQLTSGTDALVICGTTGEASTMSFDEKCEVIRFAVEHVGGKVPVIAGTGANNTKDAVKMSQAAEKAGANALLVVTPYYNKTTQAGLTAHYNAIADAVTLPIILYNVPGRTGLNILPKTVKELCKHKNIVAIKEASGNISQIAEIAGLCPDCDIYSGNDDQVLPIMSLGGKGVISTVSNIIPREMHELCASFSSGNYERALKLQLRMLPMCKAAFCEVNPIPIKTMLSLYGMCEGELRLPLIPPQEENLHYIENAMKEYGLI